VFNGNFRTNQQIERIVDDSTNGMRNGELDVFGNTMGESKCTYNSFQNTNANQLSFKSSETGLANILHHPYGVDSASMFLITAARKSEPHWYPLSCGAAIHGNSSYE
jgi:hypothetical protein